MIRNQNQEVDVVSTGLVLAVVGLLLILFASVFSDFFYIPREITGYEDKNTRLPTSIPPQTFFQMGIILAIIGFLIFLKKFVNSISEGLSRELDKRSHH